MTKPFRYGADRWGGKYLPEEITPEYIRTLSIPDALRLLAWLNFKLANNKATSEPEVV